MESFLENLQNDPTVLIIVAALAVVIALAFTLPALLKYFKSLGLPTIKAPEEKSEKTTEAKPAASNQKKPALPTFTFNLSLKSFKIKSPKALAVGIVVIIAALVVGYFAYDFFFRPVRVVSAWQLRLEQGAKIKELQEGGLAVWPTAKIYLLDVRSRDDYAKEHLRGSGSLPANRAEDEFYPIEDVVVVVYSGQHGYDLAKGAADDIWQNGQSGRVNYKNQGKIYVVKDGFEGLKNSGLTTEEGEWD
ncbi:MAG: rhodanese-like domain-containing protein [Candidatus Woykebacteria bacterium]